VSESCFLCAVIRRLHDTTDCQIGCTTGWMFFYTMQPVVQLALQLNIRLYKRLTTSWMFVYTIQPVVQPVVKPVWHQVVSCKWGFKKQLSHSFSV